MTHSMTDETCELEARCLKSLDELEIPFTLHRHPPVYTVEEAKAHRGALEGAHIKNLFLCDRKRDMVISGGVNIYPAEIEAELVALPGVADCAVFGIPDAEFGESLIGLLRHRAEAEMHCFQRLVQFLFSL